MLFFGCWHGQTRDGRSRRVVVLDLNQFKFMLLKKTEIILEKSLQSIQCVRKNVKYDLGMTIYFENYNSPVNINLDSIQDRDDLAHLLRISSKGRYVEYLKEQFGTKYELTVDCKKKGSFGWLSRVFVLQNYHICIFHNREQSCPASCLSLLGCEAQLSENTITIYFPSRAYVFSFSDAEVAKTVFLKVSKVKKQEQLEPRLSMRTLPPEIREVLIQTEGFRPTKYGLLNDLVVRTIESGTMRVVKGTVIKVVNIEQHTKHLTITIIEPVKGKSRIDKMKNFLGSIRPRRPGASSPEPQKKTIFNLPLEMKLKWSQPPVKFSRNVLNSLDKSNIMYWGMNHLVTDRNIHEAFEDPERLDMLTNNTYCAISAAQDGHFCFGITLEQKVYVFGSTKEPGERSPMGIGEVTSAPDPQFVRGLKDVKIIQIAASAKHTLALSAEKNVYGWGSKDMTGLGEDTNHPEVLAFLKDFQVIGVSACSNHSAVWTKEGHCYTFGLTGPWLGLGEKKTQNAAGVSIPFGRVQFNGMQDIPILKVICSVTHTMTLFKNGVVGLFGMNQYGQIGVGEKYASCDIPVYINLIGCVDIACGRFHSLVVVQDLSAARRGDKAKTKVYGFGTLKDSRLGMNNLPKELTSKGNLYFPTEIPHLSRARVVRVICSNDRSFAITEDGCLLQWGKIPSSPVMRNPSVIEVVRPYQIFDVACGKDFSCVLGNKLDGGLVNPPMGLRPRSKKRQQYFERESQRAEYNRGKSSDDRFLSSRRAQTMRGKSSEDRYLGMTNPGSDPRAMFKNRSHTTRSHTEYNRGKSSDERYGPIGLQLQSAMSVPYKSKSVDTTKQMDMNYRSHSMNNVLPRGSRKRTTENATSSILNVPHSANSDIIQLRVPASDYRSHSANRTPSVGLTPSEVRYGGGEFPEDNDLDLPHVSKTNTLRMQTQSSHMPMQRDDRFRRDAFGNQVRRNSYTEQSYSRMTGGSLDVLKTYDEESRMKQAYQDRIRGPRPVRRQRSGSFHIGMSPHMLAAERQDLREKRRASYQEGANVHTDLGNLRLSPNKNIYSDSVLQQRKRPASRSPYQHNPFQQNMREQTYGTYMDYMQDAPGIKNWELEEERIRREMAERRSPSGKRLQVLSEFRKDFMRRSPHPYTQGRRDPRFVENDRQVHFGGAHIPKLSGDSLEKPPRSGKVGGSDIFEELDTISTISPGPSSFPQKNAGDTSSAHEAPYETPSGTPPMQSATFRNTPPRRTMSQESESHSDRGHFETKSDIEMKQYLFNQRLRRKLQDEVSDHALDDGLPKVPMHPASTPINKDEIYDDDMPKVPMRHASAPIGMADYGKENAAMQERQRLESMDLSHVTSSHQGTFISDLVSEGKGSLAESVLSELDTPSNYGSSAHEDKENETDACEMVLCVIS